jgi:carboxylesterase
VDHPPVMPGAEPSFAEGNRVGILVVHGFTGTPYEMRFLAEGLAAAGFTVALPRLVGHGTTPADLAAATASDWTADIVAAIRWLQQRCDALFMTGLSMGGTLTLWAAGQFPDLLRGIIPINSAIYLHAPDAGALAFAPDVPAYLPKGEGGGSTRAEGVFNISYSVTPAASLKHLFALMKVTEEMLPRVTCPTLLITSRTDYTVPPANAEYIRSRIGAAEKEILWLENSYHVATLDHDKERILQAIVSFIRRHA